jgi:type II secretory pathway component GspD/PulD (secretin)
MKPAILAAVLAAAAALIVVFRRGESAPVEPRPADPAVEAAATPAEASAPAEAPVAPAAPRRRGITVCRLEEGSKADPNAPPQPTAVHALRREAVMAKWRESKVDLLREETTIQELAADIGRCTGLLLQLDPTVSAASSLSLSMTGTNGEDALSMISDVLQLEWVIDAEGASWLVPPDKVALYECPEERQIKDLARMRETLAAEAAPATADPRIEKWNALLDATRISLSLRDVTLNHAMGLLVALHNVPLKWDLASIADSRAIHVNVDANDSTARETLTSMLEPVGLAFAVEESSIVVGTPEGLKRRAAEAALQAESKATALSDLEKAEEDLFSRTVVIEGDSLAIRDIAERVSKALGIGYIVDAATWERAARYGFDGEPHTLREIFQALSKGAPVRVTYREGKFWFLSVEGAKPGDVR